MKKILITGISGSGGSYLAEHILNNYKNCSIHGFSRWHSTTSSNNLENIKNKINVHEVDLCDFSSTFLKIKKIKPDIIFHLAAHANVRASFDTPLSVFNNNCISTLNLLEAIRLSKSDPIIQICSTSEVYGVVSKKETPINELNQMRPASPYAVSKVASDLLGYTYFKNYKLKIIRTRMFSYINPRREDLFATSFAKQVAWVEAGILKYVKHGNLNSVRTIVDVDDAMRAYWLAVKHCTYGEAYNIGGIYKITVEEFLKKLISFSNKSIPTKLDKKLLRPTDVTLQVPDNSKFIKATNWKPKVSIDKSIEKLLNYWRNNAKLELHKRKI